MSDPTNSSATPEHADHEATAPAADVEATGEAPEEAPSASAQSEPGAAPAVPEPVGAEPLEPVATAGEAEPGPRPTHGGEQVEWQLVRTGDQVAWQPVMSADVAYDEGYDGGADDDQEVDVADDISEDAEGWDPDPGPSSPGNGAAGAYAAGRGARPPARRPPARRPPSAAARRPAPARRPVAAARRVEEFDNEDDESGEVGLAAKQKRQVLVLSLLTVLVIGVGITGFVLSRGASKAGNEATGGTGGDTTVPRAGVTIPEDQMQRVHDPGTNFNIKVPKAWRNLETPFADIRLVMAAGENDGLRIRVLPIQTPATVDNIGNFKEVTDAIVFGDESAKLIQEQLIRVNGLLAYHYVYTFQDKTTNQQGVHAHYFVFEGNRMFSVVFQTVPTEDFRRLAPVFDQVAESFTVGPAPVVTTTTTP